MYREGGYIQVVEDCARQSMAAVAQEVKALTNYAKDGEVHISFVVYIMSLLHPLIFFFSG